MKPCPFAGRSIMDNHSFPDKTEDDIPQLIPPLGAYTLYRISSGSQVIMSLAADVLHAISRDTASRTPSLKKKIVQSYVADLTFFRHIGRARFGKQKTPSSNAAPSCEAHPGIAPAFASLRYVQPVVSSREFPDNKKEESRSSPPAVTR